MGITKDFKLEELSKVLPRPRRGQHRCVRTASSESSEVPGMSLHGHAATRSNDPRRILTCGNDTLFVSALTVPFRVQYFHLPEKAVA